MAANGHVTHCKHSRQMRIFNGLLSFPFCLSAIQDENWVANPRLKPKLLPGATSTLPSCAPPTPLQLPPLGHSQASPPPPQQQQRGMWARSVRLGSPSWRRAICRRKSERASAWRGIAVTAPLIRTLRYVYDYVWSFINMSLKRRPSFNSTARFSSLHNCTMYILMRNQYWAVLEMFRISI